MISCHASPVALLKSPKTADSINNLPARSEHGCQNWYSVSGLSEQIPEYGRRLPEQKSQSLEKGLEVVVVIYGRLFIQLNVTKHLRDAACGITENKMTYLQCKCSFNDNFM